MLEPALPSSHRLKQEHPTLDRLLNPLPSQVWGELIFGVPENELEEAKHLVKIEMKAVGKKLGLSVPLKADLGVEKHWRAPHPYE